MDIPFVVCYTTEQALKILAEKGIKDVEVIKTRIHTALDEYCQEQRVICQRVQKGTVQIFVC